MIQKGLLLDSLEEKAIFRWSRFFYHLLVAIGGFGVLGGLLILLYSLTPTFKDTINPKPEPAPVKVTAEAVKAALQPKVESAVTTTSKSGDSPQQAPTKQENPRLQAAMDKLKSLLPEDTYKWESERVFVRRMFFGGEWQTKDVGIKGRIKELLSIYEKDVGRQVEVLENLAVALAQFEVADRLAPLKAFIKLQRDQEKARRESIRQNQAEYEVAVGQAEGSYQLTVAQKAATRYMGLIVVGSGAAAIAVLAIFLVLLSIQREVKRLATARENKSAD